MNYLLQLLEGETIFGVNWTVLILMIAGIVWLYKQVYLPWKKSIEGKHDEEKSKNEKVEIAYVQALENKGTLNNVKDIITEMRDTQNEVLSKLDALSEQNRKYELADVRAELLQAYRYYTDEKVNPMLAWTAMEAHAFFEQFGSYEDLGGNDYMHSDVRPEMNKLRVIPMNDLDGVASLMQSRRNYGLMTDK